MPARCAIPPTGRADEPDRDRERGRDDNVELDRARPHPVLSTSAMVTAGETTFRYRCRSRLLRDDRRYLLHDHGTSTRPR
jgi:hypothetical protein